MKACSKCKEIKHATDFAPDKRSPTGLQSQCRSCKKPQDAAYRAANKEKVATLKAEWEKSNRAHVNEMHRAWKASHPEIVKHSKAKYYAKNKDKVRASNDKWRSANPEKVKSIIARWAAANQEAIRTHKQNRRSRVRGASGKISKNVADRLMVLQKGKCACGCKQPLGENFHRDHIMPLALGGSNTDDNIQLLRPICNMQKYAKHPIDFMQSKGFLL